MIPIDALTLGVSYRHPEGGRYTITGFPSIIDENGEECPGVSYKLTDESDPTEHVCSAVQFSSLFTWEPV